MTYDKDKQQTGPMTLEELQQAFEDSNKIMTDTLAALIALLQEANRRNCELPPFC